MGHLGVLEREGRLAVWDDRAIGAGADWLAEILRSMEEASVAVLLVSADFLISRFIREKEVEIGHPEADARAAYVQSVRARLEAGGRPGGKG